MKNNYIKVLFAFALLISACTLSHAQNQVTLKFTGRNQYNGHVKLSQVWVENTTQRWQEMLYYPDTVLYTGSTGLQDYISGKPTFQLFQNVPNPFDGETDFSLQLPEQSEVQLEILDISGKVMTTYKGLFEEGMHLFRARLSTPQTYLLSARADNGALQIKMVNTGNAGQNSLEYLGKGGAMVTWEQQNGGKGGTTFPFTMGDEMKYVGYAHLEGLDYTSQIILQNQYQSEEITLTFNLPLPTVSTLAATTITSSSGKLNGNVSSDGACSVTERGFLFADNEGMSGAVTYLDGNGTGDFSYVVTNLERGDTYYYQAFATNCYGTAYGEKMNFQTLAELPTVVTVSVSNVMTTEATCHGNVTNSGGASVLSRGFCYSTSQNPTTNDNFITMGSGTGSFSGLLSALSPGTTYYVRAYATNSAGTAYGEQLSFTTLVTVPTVTTNTVSNITATTATCGGNVIATGGASVTACGVCWSTSQNPTVSNSHTTNGSGTGSFTSSLTGLTAGTTYYVRAYATNGAGTAYGEQQSFTTSANTPTVTTNTVSNITATTATCGGNVTATGGASVTARGVCWSTSQNPTVNNSHTSNGSGTGNFTSSITGLTASTTYYVRAYATNSAGTAYGEQRSFTTSASSSFTCGTSTVTDYDGNTYNTVQIGQQCWTKENLRTTHYTDGTSIPVGGSNTSETNPYYYDYSSSGIALSSRGYLYNWPAAMHGAVSSSANPSGVQGICPTGWHLPSDAEWTQLTDYVGSQSEYTCGGNSSNIAKALASTTGWNSSTNTCAVGNSQSTNNATGFSAVPAGTCSGSSFYYAGLNAYFWSSTEYNSYGAYNRILNYDNANVYRYANYKSNGRSVRCLRDASGGGTASLPTVTTNTVSNITATTATCGGNVTATGGATVTARGVCWSTSQNPTVSNSHTTNGSGMGNFTSSITGLTAGTTYYVRAYATNSAGTAYGEQRSFTTSANPPTVTTNTVSNITATTATCGGNVTSAGSSSVTARGVCWSTSQNPTVSNSHTTNGSGTGSFTSSITGLTASTTYYVRAYATNSAGTAYGEQRSFTTSASSFTCGTSTVTDYDGNTYNTVQIGQQCWMKENMRTTHYSDGTSIPAGGSNTSTTSPYYYDYSSSGIALSSRGYLYNWPAVMHGAASSSANPSGVQGICPTGWHLPSDAEWTQLTDYVSSQSQYVCGSNNTYIAKALASETGWNSSTNGCAMGNNQSANNATGFGALPAGNCYGSSFYNAGSYANFWSSTQDDGYNAYRRSLCYKYPLVNREGSGKVYGHSVRCVKN